MTFTGKLFRFFIYSNLFIACCAVLMVRQTCQLLLHTNPGIPLISFIFFATVCSYSFHWYLTPVEGNISSSRVNWLNQHRRVHLLLLIIGVIGTIISAFFLLNHWHWLLTAALVTFLYSAPKIPHRSFRMLRKIALGKTIFLAFTWTYVTSILPLQIEAKEWSTAFSVFAAHRFFLIYAICILFDYRDREYDKSIGIRSLITWLSERNITILFTFSVILFVIFTIWLAALGQPLHIIIILLLPGLITAALYNYAKKNFSDILYYFILDGLMALSPLLTLFI